MLFEFDSETSSTRLRELRKSKAITYESLGQCIGVSAQVLKNYESAAVSCGWSLKADAFAGMRVETLFKLAQFFGVSTDYLLGLTSNRTRNKDLDAVCKFTGLSQGAIEKLVTMKKNADSRAYSDALSIVLENDNFEYFWGFVCGYFESDKNDAEQYTSGMSTMAIPATEMAMYAATNALRTILDDSRSAFLCRYTTTQERLDKLMAAKIQKLKMDGDNDGNK